VGAAHQAPVSGQVRLAELLAALSLATDLADGFPPETALKTCLIAVTLGAEFGLLSRALVRRRQAGLVGSNHLWTG